MSKSITLLSLCLLALTSQLHAADFPAMLKSVIIYRSGAELRHTAMVRLEPGNNEVTIEHLASSVDINSIRVGLPGTVTVLSMQFSNNYLAPAEVSPRVRFLQDSLQQLQKEKEKTDMALTNARDLLEVLKANRDIKGQAGLSVTELEKLMDYYKNKSAELQAEIYQLSLRNKKTDEQIGKLQNQLREEQAKGRTNEGRLQLQLSSALAGKFDVSISYVTRSASWTPYYDIKAQDNKSSVELVYQAKIRQFTGLDWKQVKMTLSAAQPEQWSAAPTMSSWFLAYINPLGAIPVRIRGTALRKDTEDYASAREMRSETANLSEVVVTAPNTPLYILEGKVVNAADFAAIDPNMIKEIKVLKDEQATEIYGSRAANGVIEVELKEGLQDHVSVDDDKLDVSFDLDIPYDVPSNGKEQLATIQVYQVPVSFRDYAVPKNDAETYRLAGLTGWEKFHLLPGEAGILYNGVYSGKSSIDPASTLDTLNLTMGHDKRVVITRTKRTDFSSVKFLGSNKLQKFVYEISVRNTRTDSAHIDLKDQYPISTNKDIEVELLQAAGAEVNPTTGILSWRLSLAPGESRKIEFSYTIKYPKDKTLNLN